MLDYHQSLRKLSYNARLKEFVVRKFHMNVPKCALQVTKPNPNKPKIAITV